MVGSAPGQDQGDEGHVFVSYARADEAWATAIIDRLGQAGFKVWWDGLIPGGERFSAQIDEALERARAVVVLWSKSSLKSDWVQDEAGVGRDRHRLVPLSIDGSLPPLGFRQIQSIDVAKDGPVVDNRAFDKVVACVGDLLDRAPQKLPPRTRGTRVDRRTALLAGGAGLLAVGGFGAWKFLSPRADAGSIAVLPFDNLSGASDQAYLSDGLAAELRARLSRDPDIKVVGQASSKALASNEDSGKAIARKLGVANLLDGNIRVAGEQVRIAIELIDGKTGFSKWSNSFDRPLANLLQLQEDVAAAVVSALLPRLTTQDPESVARGGGTRNERAFDAYLRGKETFESHKDEASERGAVALFGEALRYDPNYAAALAARSRALAVVANQYAQSAERRTLYDEAVSEARKAIAAAPQFPEGHAALGYALFYGKLDVKAADEPYRKAAEYGEGNADVQALIALYRARRKQFGDALPAIDRAASLDPLNPSIVKTRGRIDYARGDYDAAIAAANRVLEMNPNHGGAHGDIGNAYLMLGKVDEALSAFAKEGMGLLSQPGLAIALARKGDQAGAQAAYRRLVADEGDNGLYQQAQVLAQWGQTEEALAALDKAAASGDSGLVYLLSDPFLEPLKNQPRFKALLSRLHFV